jgi:tripartite-type tricarboxylate transporter receptor subunit TctC
MQWYGMVAPAGTPAPVIARLHGEAVKALHSDEMKEKLALDGAQPVGSSPAELAALIKSELEKWSRVARAAEIPQQ